MSDSDVSFIGEEPADNGEVRDPLALSSRDCSSSSCSDDDSDKAARWSRHKTTAAEATKLLDSLERDIAAFDRVAPALRSHEYITNAPTQAGDYQVAGLARFRGKLLAETAHVRRALAQREFGTLRGNNVAALGVAVGLMATEPDVSAVMFHVPYLDGSARKTVEIDLITNGGSRWIKVKSSSANNFLREVGLRRGAAFVEGDAIPEAGDSAAPFLDTLRTLLRAAAGQGARLPFSKHPEIVVACAEEPPAAVRRAVAALDPSIVIHCVGGARGKGSAPRGEPYFASDGRVVAHFRALPRSPPYRIAALNFDVTALVALVCDCCHGHAGVAFPLNPILHQQSADEAAGIRAIDNFILPEVKRHTVWQPVPEGFEEAEDALCALTYPEGGDDGSDQRLWPANWIASTVAIEEFRWILDTISGPTELRRAKWLLPRIQARPPSLTTAGVAELKATKRIKNRHRAVFGVGDHEHALTITGNRTFVQAAIEQGLGLLVAFHPSRALTERKRLAGLQGRAAGPEDPAVAQDTVCTP